MNYNDWSIEDFLSDDGFLQYCYGTDGQSMSYWEKLRTANPDLAERMDQAMRAALLLAVQAEDEQKKADWQRIRQTLRAADHTIDKPEPPSTSRIRSLRKVWLAAAVATTAAVMLAGGALLWNGRGKGSGEYPTKDFSLLASTDMQARRTIQLPDGTTVLLNRGSELKIAPDFNRQSRRLLLQGEAFFTVKQDPDRPFVVISGNTAVTVLGTAFKVRNYRAEKQCSVMLDAGKVRVEAADATEPRFREELQPGDLMIVHEDHGFSRDRFDQKRLRQWQAGQLVFQDAGLLEITARLEELYGVRILTTNKPAQPLSFTGTFEDKPLKEVLDAIGFTNQFSYAVQNDTVHITFN